MIKTDNHDDFQTYFQQHLDELYAQIDAGNVGDGYTKEMAYDDLFHGIIESIVYPRIKYILTRVYIMRRWKRLREEKVKI